MLMWFSAEIGAGGVGMEFKIKWSDSCEFFQQSSNLKNWFWTANEWEIN